MKAKLTEKDFEWAAQQLNVEVSAIKAVDAVESRGSGFYSDDQPTILFERHVFSRETGGIYDEHLPNLSNKKPGGYGSASGINQHFKLQQAAKLNLSAALKSASWGRFQIMGFNHKLAGFKDVQSFVVAMHESEREQLKAFVNFLKSTGLDKPLRAKNWALFAKGYNGAGYAKNAYDVKLKQAYDRFKNENK